MFLHTLLYVVTVLLYVGLQYRPFQLSRTTWFGTLNAAAIVVLFGMRAALAFIILTGALWLSLETLRRTRAGGLRNVVEFGLYAGVTLAFLFHKVMLDFGGLFLSAPSGTSDAASSISHVLQLLAFSYVFLRALDAIRVVASGGSLLKPVSLSGYLFPFFMTPAGPINVYADHLKMDAEPAPPPTWDEFVRCADTITSGLFLKFVIAEAWKLYFIGLTNSWPTATFFDTTIIFIYIFFDFSGYSLVALGIGRLLGIPTPVNFRNPFLSNTITEFWTRWHISLGDFIRRGLFAPLQVAMLRRVGRQWAYGTNLIALIICFSLVGLWHRITYNFLIWGFCIGLIVAIEKVVRNRWMAAPLSRNPRLKIVQSLLGPVYVFVVVIGSLHFVMPELLGQAR